MLPQTTNSEINKMSATRAILNCERCYGLANIVEGSPDEGVREKILKNSQIYEARNEALRALEESLRYCQNTHINLSAKMKILKKILLEGQIEVIKALEACGNCDYSSPRIAESLKRRKVLEFLAQEFPEKFSQDSE